MRIQELSGGLCWAVTRLGNAPASLKLAVWQTLDELYSPIQGGQSNNTALESETIGDYQYKRRALAETNDLFKMRFGPFKRIGV